VSDLVRKWGTHCYKSEEIFEETCLKLTVMPLLDEAVLKKSVFLLSTSYCYLLVFQGQKCPVKPN
jgi:hypothetical protein